MFMSLILWREMRRGDLVMERVRTTLNEMRKWSVMGSSAATQSMGVTPEQHLR